MLPEGKSTNHSGGTRLTAVNGKPANEPVCVVHRLSHRAVVLVKSDELPATIFHEGDYTKDSYEIELENGARMQVRVGTLNPGTWRGTLVPVEQPCDAINTGELPQSVEFSILNFPQFLVSMIHGLKSNGQLCRVGVARFEAGPWIAEISSVPDFERSGEDVACGWRARCDSYRENGAFGWRGIFYRTAAKFLRYCDHSCLCHGAFCGIASAIGKDQHGGICWERWGHCIQLLGVLRLRAWADRPSTASSLKYVFSVWHLVTKR